MTATRQQLEQLKQDLGEAQGLFERNFRIDGMELVQINAFELEALQALRAGLAEVLGCAIRHPF